MTHPRDGPKSDWKPYVFYFARKNGFADSEACASCTAVSAMVIKFRETAVASLRTTHGTSLLSRFLGATPRRQKAAIDNGWAPILADHSRLRYA